LIGRPVFWGLAVNGEAGVRDVLRILEEELLLAMRLAGRPTIASIDRSLVKTTPLFAPYEHATQMASRR
jgi:isopentenyl diphosphate isomerase/L-lactate dehydrogenase-like FMN-dependent dehydrogenase